MSPEIALAFLLGGLLLGMGLCGFIWAAGERAERRERIERARLRDHAKVPSIRAVADVARGGAGVMQLECATDGVVIHVDEAAFREWEAAR